MKMACGCSIASTGPLYIVYCPLHKAAPEMLEALKKIEDDDWCMCGCEKTARNAIRTAEGGN